MGGSISGIPYDSMQITPLMPPDGSSFPICEADPFPGSGEQRRDIAIQPYYALPVPEFSMVAPAIDLYSTIDFTGASTPDVFTNTARLDLMSGRSSSWLVINLSGLKHVNDTFAGGHEAGNAYLNTWQQILRQLAVEQGIPANRVTIVRDGPNFALNVPDGVAGDNIMHELHTRFAGGVEIRYNHNGQAVTETLSPQMLEGKLDLVNTGTITFDSASLSTDNGIRITEDGIYRTLREQIYYLNRAEIDTNRLGEEFYIDAQHASLLDSYSLEARLVGYSEIAHEASEVLAPAGTYAEPRSGLRNHQQLLQDGAEILRSGRSVRFAFFDGNAMGSFRTLGFAGEAMMDAVVEARIAQAAASAGLPEMGIRVYRHGSGSEEFYLLADDSVSPETMEQAGRNLMAELNRTPFEIRLERSSLEATEMGQRYLAEHPNAVTEMIEGTEFVRVDITEVTRGRSGAEYRGLTITFGHGTIAPPENQGDIGETFQRSAQRIMEYGEGAKQINPARRNALVRVNMVNGEAVGRFIPLEPALSNPRPIEGQRAGMIDEAVEGGDEINFSIEEAQVTSVKVREYRPELEYPAEPVEVRPETPASPESQADALARMQLSGEINLYNAGSVTILLSDLAEVGESLADGRTRFNLEHASGLEAELLRQAGITEIVLPQGVSAEALGQLTVSEEALATALAEGKTTLVSNPLGHASAMTPAEAAAYQPAAVSINNALQMRSLSEFRSSLEAAGIDRLGETRLSDLSFEQLQQLSERPLSELRHEYNLNPQQARALNDSAKLTVTQYNYTLNLVTLAQTFGVEVNGANAGQIADMLYAEYAARGEGYRFFNPDRLFEFFGTEEGRAFLETPEGQNFSERVVELQRRYDKASRAGRSLSNFGVEFGGLLVSLGVFLGAERLAEVMGIENPLGKTVFVLGLMHTATESAVPLADGAWLRLMSGQGAREAGRGLMVAAQDLQGFRLFWEARFGSSSVTNLARQGVGQLFSRAALGRFMMGVGQFTIIMHSYEGALDIAGVNNGSVLRHPITGFIVSGVAMIGIQRLMTTVLVNTMAARIWTKALGPIGVAFFVADLIEMGRLAFMDDYNRTVELAVQDMSYDGTDQYITEHVRHCTNATRSWINIVGILRSLMIVTDSYRGEDAEAAGFEPLSASQFNREQVRQVLLALNTGKEGAGFRQAIMNLQALNPPDDISDNYTDHGMIQRGVDGADRYFDEQGRFRTGLVDEFIDNELFATFPESDEYRVAGTTYTLDLGPVTNQLTDIDNTLLENRRLTRISVLDQRELNGQPLNYNDQDVAAGLVTTDGQLDHTSNKYLEFASRSAYIAAHTEGPETIGRQNNIRLRIINLRLQYLATRDTAILRELDAWGDRIDVPAWEARQSELQEVVNDLEALDLTSASSALAYNGILASASRDLDIEISIDRFTERSFRSEESTHILNTFRSQNLATIREIEDARDIAAAQARGEVYVDPCAEHGCFQAR